MEKEVCSLSTLTILTPLYCFIAASGLPRAMSTVQKATTGPWGVCPEDPSDLVKNTSKGHKLSLTDVRMDVRTREHTHKDYI